MRDHFPGFIVPSPFRPPHSADPPFDSRGRSKSVAEEVEGREVGLSLVRQVVGRIAGKITESKKERRKKGNQLSGQ